MSFFSHAHIFITNVCNLECLTDRHMQESRKNHQDCLMSLQFEMLYGNYLGGICTAFVLFEILDYHICYKVINESGTN